MLNAPVPVSNLLSSQSILCPLWSVWILHSAIHVFFYKKYFLPGWGGGILCKPLCSPRPADLPTFPLLPLSGMIPLRLHEEWHIELVCLFLTVWDHPNLHFSHLQKRKVHLQEDSTKDSNYFNNQYISTHNISCARQLPHSTKC